MKHLQSGIVFSVLIPLLLCGPPAEATTYFVGPAEMTIEAALAAANIPGDVISIRHGTYHWSGLFAWHKTDLLIWGDDVIVDIPPPPNPPLGYYCFIINECTDLTIRGITFQNGDVTSSGAPLNQGGAVFVDSCDRLLFEDCRFVDNDAVNGGALYIQDSSVGMTNDCSFTGNSATKGGAIYLSDSFLRAEGVTLTGNAASGSGGALACVNGSTCVICGSTVVQNVAGQYGGGIYAASTCASPTTRVELCSPTMYLNTALSGPDGYSYEEVLCQPPTIIPRVYVRTDASWLPATWSSPSGHGPEVVPPADCPLKSVSYPGSPHLVSLVVSPAGNGQPFNEAHYSSGFAADATLSVWGFPPDLPATSFQLGFDGLDPGEVPPEFAPCPEHWPVYADGPTNALGTTTFSLPLCAAGNTEGFPLVVWFVPDGQEPQEISHGDYPAEIYFNSPADVGWMATPTIVDAWDLKRFLKCYGSGSYLYEHDVLFDSVINLADLVFWLPFLYSRCSTCPY